ncbi:MAG: Gx transporter family protein [Clostridia bacterium]|nr:Gx transporter family protein [Clostridia bacterium]
MKKAISSPVRRYTVDAVLLASALILSYIESAAAPLIPVPIPGFKLGLANITVMFAVYTVGTLDGLLISLARTALSSILFGSVSSFMFSVAGAVLSFAALCLCKYYIKDRLSVYGISMMCAAFHNIGQVLAASAVMRTMSIFAYLPYLLLASIPCGLLTGLIAGLLLKREDIRRIAACEK